MTKKIKLIGKLVAVAALTIFATSCNKDMSDDPQQMLRTGVKRYISASAQLPGSTADKAYLNTTTSKVVWELSDEINVNGSAMHEIMLHNDFAEPQAVFEGTVNAMQSLTNDEEVYWAVYPKNLSTLNASGIPADFQEASLTFSLPSSQNYSTANPTLAGNTYMAAYARVPQGSTDLYFNMKNLGAVVCLKLTAASGVSNTQASRIEFSTTNGALAGQFSIANDTVTITPSASATQTLTVNLSDGTNSYIDIATEKYVYAYLPPMTAKNLTIKIFNTDGDYTAKTATTQTLVRSKIYTNTLNNITFSETEDNYYFSVSATKKVVFSPGNLQWSATNGGTIATTHRTAEGYAAGTWRFAEHQWSYVGNNTYGNVYNNAGAKSNNAQISSTYNGWIDLLGWGTSGFNDKYPYMTSSTNTNYGGGDNNITNTYYDWGMYNDIYNPAKNRIEPYGTWYTLTSDEWKYVFYQRTSASSKLGAATVNGIKGIILLPDNWAPQYPAGFQTFNAARSAYNNNVYTAENWDVMEQNGAVFIPATYNRDGTTLTNQSSNFRIWSSSKSGTGQAWLGYVWVSGSNQSSTTDYRHLGESVRLVKDYVEN